MPKRCCMSITNHKLESVNIIGCSTFTAAQHAVSCHLTCKHRRKRLKVRMLFAKPKFSVLSEGEIKASYTSCEASIPSSFSHDIDSVAVQGECAVHSLLLQLDMPSDKHSNMRSKRIQTCVRTCIWSHDTGRSGFAGRMCNAWPIRRQTCWPQAITVAASVCGTFSRESGGAP